MVTRVWGEREMRSDCLEGTEYPLGVLWDKNALGMDRDDNTVRVLHATEQYTFKRLAVSFTLRGLELSF